MTTRADALREAALRARAAGEHDRAIEAWRALLLRSPADWRLALELKRDLKAALHYPDSDALFRGAARHLPDAEWLEHYAGLYAFHNDDLDALHARATVLLQTRPGEWRLHALLGDVGRQRRDWAGAEAGFAAALALRPGDAELAAKLAAARRYQAVEAALAGAPGGGAAYSLAVVNLDRNAERWAEIGRQFRDCPVPLRRAPGVEGRRLSAAAVRRLGGDPEMRGTLGCFLSHAAAWEAMLARGDEFCLVVEDDVVPLLPLPPTLGPLGLPAGFELCFVNDRLEPHLGRATWLSLPDPEAPFGLHARTLAETMRGFHPEDNAPGGDGYLLSRAGAEKLVRWVEADGFVGDVDWRLVAYGLSPADIATLPRHGHAFAVLDRMRRLIGRADRLAAYALTPALIRTVGVSSDREDENRVRPG